MKRKRLEAAVILLLTLLYLCLELPFSVDLLDGVGGVASMAQLQRLEISGRLISGLALTLLVWQFFVLPWARRRSWGLFATVIACLALSFPVMFGVYQAEGTLVDHLAEQGGSHARQTAFATVLLAQGVKHQQVKIRGLMLDGDIRQRPDAKAFIALLPFMTAQMQHIRKRLMPVAETIVKNRLVVETGGEDAFFESTYRAPIKRLRSKYKQYRSGIQDYNRGYAKYRKARARYRKVVANATETGNTKYWEYRKQLASKTHSRGPAPAWKCPAIRRSVKSQYGIKIPHDWNCWARAPFAAAVALRIRSQASSKLDAARHKLANSRPSHVITSFDAFVHQPAVREKLLGGWRDTLHLNVPTSAVSTKHTVASWNKLVYQPWLDVRARAIVSHFIDHVNDFDPGGSYYERGKAARKMLLIPAVALFFSLLGALTHIVKILVEASVVAYPRSVFHVRARLGSERGPLIPDKRALLLRPGLFVVGVVLVVCPIAVSTPITRSPVFASIEQAMRLPDTDGSRAMGATAAAFARWTIQTEAVVYPINAILRDKVNLLYNFERGWLVRTLAKHSAPLVSPLGGE